jgi:hypothetical protein
MKSHAKTQLTTAVLILVIGVAGWLSHSGITVENPSNPATLAQEMQNGKVRR